jgi:hypothetical protein
MKYIAPPKPTKNVSIDFYKNQSNLLREINNLKTDLMINEIQIRARLRETSVEDYTIKQTNLLTEIALLKDVYNDNEYKHLELNRNYICNFITNF